MGWDEAAGDKSLGVVQDGQAIAYLGPSPLRTLDEKSFRS